MFELRSECFNAHVINQVDLILFQLKCNLNNLLLYCEKQWVNIHQYKLSKQHISLIASSKPLLTEETAWLIGMSHFVSKRCLDFLVLQYCVR